MRLAIFATGGCYQEIAESILISHASPSASAPSDRDMNSKCRFIIAALTRPPCYSPDADSISCNAMASSLQHGALLDEETTYNGAFTSC